MFGSKIRTDALTFVRSSLPQDTGNLRFNGTKEVGNRNKFTITIGGSSAYYFEFLEELSTSKYHKNLDEKIVPKVVLMIEAHVNKKSYRRDLAMKSRENMLEKAVQDTKGNYGLNREQTLLDSLFKTGEIE